MAIESGVQGGTVLDPALPHVSVSRPMRCELIGGVAGLMGLTPIAFPLQAAVRVHLQKAIHGQLLVELVEEGHSSGRFSATTDRMAPLPALSNPVLAEVFAWLRGPAANHFTKGVTVLVEFDRGLGAGLEWRAALRAALSSALASITGGSSYGHERLPHDPTGVLLVAFDTGFPQPSDPHMATVVATAGWMAYRILADLAGLSVKDGRRGQVTIEDPLWQGDLLKVRPSTWKGSFRSRVPESMYGDAFLNVYHGLPVAAGAIQRDQMYPVRAAADYLIEEAWRARLINRLLKPGLGAADVEILGELLSLSHTDAVRCGISCDPADLVVSLVLELGRGLTGARIAGLGGGGCVAILGTRAGAGALDELCREYEIETGLAPAIISAAP